MEAYTMKFRVGRAWLGLVILAAACWMGGCQKPAYDWGSYNASVLALYTQPADNSKTVGVQIQLLDSEIRATEKEAKANEPSRVPPGKYAQLGYLYAMQGDRVAAKKCFEAEGRLYPESGKFVDGMIARLK